MVHPKKNIRPFLLRPKEFSAISLQFFVLPNDGVEVTESMVVAMNRRLEVIAGVKKNHVTLLDCQWDSGYFSFTIQCSLSEDIANIISQTKREGAIAKGGEANVWQRGYYCRSAQIVTSEKILAFAKGRSSVNQVKAKSKK